MSGDLLKDLKDALSVEPSAEFVANIRLRVADQPMRRFGWSSAWIPASVIATAASAVWLSVGGNQPQQATVIAAMPMRIVSDRLPTTSAADLTGGRPVPIQRSARSGLDPEVLVPAGQEAALLRLAQVLEQEGTDAASLFAAMPDSSTAGMHPVISTDLTLFKDR